MSVDAEQLAAAVIDEACQQMQGSLARIGHCVRQLNDEQLWWRATPEQNSVGNLLLHLAGNIRQWIVAGVGGEPDTRDRPSEFAQRGPLPREQVLGQLAEVIEQATHVLRGLTSEELMAAKRIQGFDTHVLGAIFHVATHLQGHTQEVIALTRMQLREGYRFDFVPLTPEQGA